MCVAANRRPIPKRWRLESCDADAIRSPSCRRTLRVNPPEEALAPVPARNTPDSGQGVPSGPSYRGLKHLHRTYTQPPPVDPRSGCSTPQEKRLDTDTPGLKPPRTTETCRNEDRYEHAKSKRSRFIATPVEIFSWSGLYPFRAAHDGVVPVRVRATPSSRATRPQHCRLTV
jgi:hypothetical protein